MATTLPKNDSVSALSPAAKRSFLYGFFVESFAYPEGELLQAIGGGVLADRLRELVADLYPDMVDDVNWGALRNVDNNDDFIPSEYTRLFDTGTSGPPCALYGGIYHGPQMKTMEEVVRFYNHFGLTMVKEMKEMPDHLTTELEFLHFLCYGEDDLKKRGEDVVAYQLAQRDFIARHPGRWIPLMREKLEQAEPAPFFQVLIEVLDMFLTVELNRLETLHGRASTLPHGSLSFVEVES